ncbi:MAG: Ku protein [Flavobacteriales bacterium]
MKALWRGSIGFGLVSIPVRMYSATQESELDLDMLDAKDHARIRFNRVNERTGKEVPWERIVKGFEVDGRYVVLEDKDLKNAAREKSDVISIHDFIQEDEVEAKYFEKPYYLEPEKGGTRAYALLREALRKSGKAGVASFVMRTKEHPALIVPDGPTLLLVQLRFAEEIRDAGELNVPKAERIPPAELKLALSLIGQHTGKFDIERYKDTFTASLMRTIRAKAKGKRTAEPKLKVVHARRTDDLMEQLKASLNVRKRKAS